MTILIDTPIWSIALRRKEPDPKTVSEIASLLRDDNVALIGPVRMEVLCSIRNASLFARLRDELRTIPDYALGVQHYERAAEIFTACRSKGIQGSLADFLICAVSELDRIPIYTSDQDFKHYSRVVKIELYRNL